MKKLGFFSMMAAALLLGACNNFGNGDPEFPEDGGNDTPGGEGDTPSVVLPEGDGSETNPYNVAKALTVQDGSLAWVKGYIVGQVAGDINVPADVQFNAPFTGATYDDGTVATIGTNLLIAADPEETAILKCLVVQLPKGVIRESLELMGHPENDGKAVELYGKLTKYFGVAGLKETSQAKLDGQAVGGGSNDTPDTPVNPGVGEGDGTKANPFNVAAAIGMNNSGAKAWVKAFIVGQINGKNLSDTELDAPFNVPSGSTQGTNIIIADAADEGVTILPVQLPSGAIRNGLNLPDNPEMDGKEVLLYGSLEKYFGTNGMKSVTCAIVDGVVIGTEPSTDEPIDSSDAILSVPFTAGLGGFTTFNVSGEQTWTTDATYGAKMSGFANSASHANEDWLISPALDLSGKQNVVIDFEHAINKGDVNNLTTNHTMWMSTDYNEGDPTAANWTQVEIVTYPDGKSWTYVNSGNIAVPAEFLTANVRFAFKYLCSDSESATWEIRNLIVK